MNTVCWYSSPERIRNSKVLQQQGRITTKNHDPHKQTDTLIIIIIIIIITIIIILTALLGMPMVMSLRSLEGLPEYTEFSLVLRLCLCVEEEEETLRAVTRNDLRSSEF